VASRSPNQGSSASNTAVRPGTYDPNFRNTQGTLYSGNLQGAIQNSNLQHQSNSLENRKNVAAQQAIQNQEVKQVNPTQSSVNNMVSNMDAQRANLSGWGQKRTPQQLNQLANLNTAIGFNPTQGMGPLNSMKYNFTNPQFKSDVSKLANAPMGVMGLGMNLIKKAFGNEQPTGIASLPTMYGGPRMPMIPTNPNLISIGQYGDYSPGIPTGQGPLYGTSAADQVLEMGGPWRDSVSGAPVMTGEEGRMAMGMIGDAFDNVKDWIGSGVDAAGDWAGNQWDNLFRPEVQPTDPNDAFLNAYTGLDEFTDRMTQQYARTPETANMLTDSQGFAVNQPEDFESGYVNRLDAGPLSDNYEFTDTSVRDLMAQREAEMAAQQAAEQDASQFDIRDLLDPVRNTWGSFWGSP